MTLRLGSWNGTGKRTERRSEPGEEKEVLWNVGSGNVLTVMLLNSGKQ